MVHATVLLPSAPSRSDGPASVLGGVDLQHSDSVPVWAAAFYFLEFFL